MKRRRAHFRVKRLPDGRALINLGSSSRVSRGWNNLDFSWAVFFGRHPHVSAALHLLGLLHEERYRRIQQMDPDTVRWNLLDGIPFPDKTFDGVYHCHLLEHIDRDAAPRFVAECYRVLKPGGHVRVVVPDFETLVRRYQSLVARLPERGTMAEHAAAMEAMIDQMVVRTPKFRRHQKGVVRTLESIFIGDTARSGSAHRWMYDRFSLGQLLREAGFVDVRQRDERSSRIAGWEGFGLEVEPDGTPYKPDSLYMEGVRP
jgi:SAM-dependent methyltransferase